MKFTPALYASALICAPALAQNTKNSSTPLYGFIKASFLSAKNTSADYKPFFANEDATANSDYDDASHNQISVKQSRFGMNFKDNKVSGKIEFDFDGEAGNKAGATNSDSGNFRTRILEIQYKPNEDGRFSLGKRWDTFAALNPHTYSVTMVQLHQGNTGFLTEAGEYAHKLENLDLYFQMQTLGDIADYKVSTPIATARADYQINEKNKIGIALKSGSVNTKDASGTDDNVDVFGAKLFYSGELASVKVIGEAYQGRNLGAATVGASLGNIGPASAKDSSAATNEEDVIDTGYYLSLKKSFGKLGVFGGYGQVKIDTPKDVLSDGGKATNSALRAGVDYNAEKNLVLFAELTNITTGYYQSADDDIEEEKGSLLDVGMIYRF